jgi:hypothetical protein
MAPHAELDSKFYIGREPERLSITERQAAAGRWFAMQMYSPQTLPLRRIEALGANVQDCMKQLASRGLDPRVFEYQLMTPSY